MQLAIIAAVAATLTQTANPCADCGPAVGSCVVDDDGTATCYLHCKKSCGEVVRHGWSGYDDGDNACNMCKCSDGNLACTNLKCVDVPCPAEVCKDATKCGGITGARCLSREHVCLDDPADGCNPDEGDADCAGCCVLDQCFQKECKDGYVCELNWFGQAECVHPCSKIECKEGSTCQLNADGKPVCYKSCEKTCGDVVPHGWGGFDDGSNACNKCGCADGSMICTKRACLDVPCPADVCKGATKCGGITGASCFSRTQVCIDNPADACNPDEGDADCIGCCVLDQCLRTECKDGYVCELNWFGQAECVHPCSKIECKEGSTCQLNADSKPVCYKSCKKTCGDVVPHGWGGFDDGSNACNKCGCADGSMVCTMMACPDVPCPSDVCKDTTKCGGITGALCLNRNQVCIDNPADDCNPDKGGADCIGCCVFDACMLQACPKGEVCELNWLGQAQCVKQ